MARRNKLEKFAELNAFKNVYQNFNPKAPRIIDCNGEEVDMKGQWSEKHFGNDHPLILELACGKGEYTLGMAEMHPDKNFIGLDVKGNRIWKGASTALEKNLDNAAFFRTRIEQIALFFGPEEISEIWITFPDPFLRKSKANRRLTSAFFINLYRKILAPNGLINLKTDSSELYEFTLETISEDPDCELIYQNDDIYGQELFRPELTLKTYYEGMHLANGKTIKFVQFRI